MVRRTVREAGSRLARAYNDRITASQITRPFQLK
jgi:hypothetical protein